MATSTSALICLDVQDGYFTSILEGVKTREGRLFKDEYKDMVPNRTTIRFTNSSGTATVDVLVLGTKHYQSFRAMLEDSAVPMARILPGVANVEDGVDIYRAFPGYRDGEAIYGVLAIDIQLLSD